MIIYLLEVPLSLMHIHFFLASITDKILTSLPYSFRIVFLASTGVLALTDSTSLFPFTSISTKKHFAPHLKMAPPLFKNKSNYSAHQKNLFKQKFQLESSVMKRKVKGIFISVLKRTRRYQ